MKRFWTMSALLITGLLVSGTAGAEDLQLASYGHPALEAINQAYESNEITLDEAMLYRLYFVKDFEKLPAQFQLEGEPVRSATPILLGVYDYAEGEASSQLRQTVANYRSRPYNLPLTRVTEHFIIHYTDTGYDAASEAYVDVIEAACEQSYQTFFVDLTWDAPPGDGYAGGGQDMIDCYIHDCGAGTLGYAEPENAVPGGAPNDQTGYFHVDNVISNIGTRSCTTSHEFMHVTQFGYNASFANIWFMENCAMIAEEFVFDNYNDYIGYINAWFAQPYKSIKTFNGVYEYGGVVWPMYQWERFDVEVVELIWEEIKWGTMVWTAFDNVFGDYGYTGIEAYMELMRWAYYTGQRYEGTHFEEAGMWSAAFYPDRTFYSYPTGEQHPSSTKKPEPYGTSIMRFNPVSGSSDNILEITFNGPDCTAGVDAMVKCGDTYYEHTMELNASGDGYIEIPNFDETCDYVFLMTSMKRECNTPKDYFINADTSEGAASVPDQGPRVRVYPSYPNPFSDHTAINYALGAGSDVSVQIYDASGRVVRDLFSGNQYAGNYELMWNGRDNAGEPVGNGVYFARIQTSEGEPIVRELTVVR